MVNKENINRLLEFIPTIPDANFDMNAFRRGDRTEHVCNSVGCIIGHATVLDTPENLKTFISYDNGWGCLAIDFEDWADDFFGLTYAKEDVKIWEYLFSGMWGENTLHNTKEAALARVQTFINNDYKAPEFDYYSKKINGTI